MNADSHTPVALVTGAGKRRVGNRIAQRLAERGFALVIHYNRSREAADETARLLRDRGARCETVQADVSDEAQVDRLFDFVGERFARLDLLVTAAAIWERKPLEEATAEDVQRHFAINTLGTFLCCRRGGLMMVDQESGGLIVTIGDWAVARPYLDYPAYFPSKGAIPTMTRMFAIELAHRNPRVRVNCIEPGPVMLPEDLKPSERRQAVAGTLVKREGSPDHVAAAVLAFVDNDYTTGVCLPVDGGRTIAAADSDHPA